MIELSGRSLTLEKIGPVATGSPGARLASVAHLQIQSAREVIDKLLAKGEVIYGVNTGFGKLADKRIADSEIEALQLNLVRSHARSLRRRRHDAASRGRQACGCSGQRAKFQLP